VLDNIAALRQATPEILASDAHLFAPPKAVRSGPAISLTWWLKAPATRARMELLDSSGAVLRTWEPDTAKKDTTNASTAARPAEGRNTVQMLPNAAGINRLTWDLRIQPAPSFPGMILWGGSVNGPAVPPGRYIVRLIADAKTLTQTLTVTRHPWITDVTDADLRAQFDFGKRVLAKVTEANNAVIAIRRVKSQVDDRHKRDADAELAQLGDTLVAHASGVEQDVYQVKNQSNQDPLNFPIKVNNRLATLLSMSERGDGRPINNMPTIFEILATEMTTYSNRLQAVWKKDLAAYNAALAKRHLPPVDPACTKAAGCVVTP
jgi:hypothetical protein